MIFYYIEIELSKSFDFGSEMCFADKRHCYYCYSLAKCDFGLRIRMKVSSKLAGYLVFACKLKDISLIHRLFEKSKYSLRPTPCTTPVLLPIKDISQHQNRPLIVNCYRIPTIISLVILIVTLKSML